MATATATPVTETTLFLKRTFKASRERVFSAWTTPDMLKQWFAAGADYAGSVAEVDLRVGGKFRMGMKHLPSGKEHIATGMYREVRVPERLVFTWRWEEQPEGGDMQITIDLRDLHGETEMHFTHEFFPNKKERNDHEKGWAGCFKSLERVLQL
jgi:uncharacterized protein YndB with AHSA1/START domain